MFKSYSMHPRTTPAACHYRQAAHLCMAKGRGRWRNYAVSDNCGDSSPSHPNSTLRADQARLEALLAQEGIELAQSSSPSALGFSSPELDWSRYHLQILFVDRTDTLRARVAAGIFDRIAAWNGFGRALLTFSCGLEAQPPTPTTHLPAASLQWPHSDSRPRTEGHVNNDTNNTDSGAQQCPSASRAPEPFNASRAAAVLSAAAGLQLSVREIARPAEQFELADLDRYDLVLCLDRGIRDAIFSQMAPADQEYYNEKVYLLSGFSQYEGDFALLARGGFALLPMQLSFLLRSGRKALSDVKLQEDVSSPELAGEQGMAEWDDMVQMLICGTAGLAKFLIDSHPENLPDWDPQD